MLGHIPLTFALIMFLSLPQPLQSSDIFPYGYKVEDLENGLRVVSVPLPNPNVISYYTIVRSGSRNEVEPGKSGFAHFFEHIMFKGTKKVPGAAYEDFLTRLGAGTNGLTTKDFTYYFVVFAGRENLEKVVATEADRFINPFYDEEMLKTEAPVIEGEYYASVSDPGRKLEQILRDTAFTVHSYKHMTLGDLNDILDMPNQFEYSQLYKKRFYAPDNSILLVVGDFDHNQLMEYIRTYYSSWQRSNYTLVTPVEPPQKEAKRIHYQWPSRTLPRLAIGFHGPAFSDENIDKPALDLLAKIAFSPTSSLYQKLVLEEQKCLTLEANFDDTRDPFLLTLTSIIKKEEDLPYVEEEILKELDRLKTELVSNRPLAEVKSNFRYSLAEKLGTTDGVASVLVPYLSLTADPGTLNKLFSLYEKVTPEDIQSVARKYFVESSSTVATLSEGPIP